MGVWTTCSALSVAATLLTACGPSSLLHQQVGHPRRFGTRLPVAH
jgi:hypothetical protein